VRAALVFAMALVVQVLTGSRGGALSLVLAVGVAVWRRTGRIPVLGVVALASVFLAVFGGIALALGKGEADPTASLRANLGPLAQGAQLYALGGVVAFDGVLQDPNVIPSTGGLLRTVNQFLNRLGAEIPIPPLHAQYLTVGDFRQINVYTAYATYFPPGGLISVAALCALVGAGLTALFYLSRRDRLVSAPLFAVLCAGIPQSVFSEPFYLAANFLAKTALSGVVLAAVAGRRIPEATSGGGVMNGEAMHGEAGPGATGSDRMRWTWRVLRRGWRTIAVAVLAAAVVTAALVLSQRRRFAAEAVLAAVTGRTGLSPNAGLAASLLGANAMVGLQATPAFLVRMARLDGVLTPVGLRITDSATGERVVDRLAEARPRGVPLDRVAPRMRGAVSTTYDTQSGLITVRVAHADSALARLVVGDVIGQMSALFLRASRAQASQLRRAQAERVDSAARRLREAEAAILVFTRAHRVVSPYSEASLEEQRLQRAVTLAQTVYSQAVSDAEAAAAKELEETPALVVVDPPAAALPPVSRGLLTKVILAAAAAGLAAAAVLLLREPRSE
jgi:hypothetical protein